MRRPLYEQYRAHRLDPAMAGALGKISRASEREHVICAQHLNFVTALLRMEHRVQHCDEKFEKKTRKTTAHRQTVSADAVPFVGE